MTLTDFIDTHLSSGGYQGSESGDAKRTAAANGSAGSGRGYLAQHPLFEQIPALASDIREPDYCMLGEGQLQSVNAWLGPAGTVRILFGHPFLI